MLASVCMASVRADSFKGMCDVCSRYMATRRSESCDPDFISGSLPYMECVFTKNYLKKGVPYI